MNARVSRGWSRTRTIVATLAVSLCVLVVASCGADSAGRRASTAPHDRRGGTLRVLYAAPDFTHLDPQRNYAAPDTHFGTAFMSRTLTTFAIAPGLAGTTVVPDMAVALGKPNATATSWTYTLRPDLRFSDGSAIGCRDIKYGTSRAFATDVITGGATYAIDYLDIPSTSIGSVYPGPYQASATQQALFDSAVRCSADDRTITFRLRRPMADFDSVMTLSSFSPVPQAKDTAESYDKSVICSGPYRVAEFQPEKTLVLERNPFWSLDLDPVRGAYPDKVVVEFGLDQKVIDRRVMDSRGSDATAVSLMSMAESSLETVFDDNRYTERRSNELTMGVGYAIINTVKVPNRLHRMALQAAVDRDAALKALGGQYAGDLADGLVSPLLTADYASTGLWTTLRGQEIPRAGNVALARKYVAESGQAAPSITLDYNLPHYDPAGAKLAVVMANSWRAAGFTVQLNPVDPRTYLARAQDADQQGSVMLMGWVPDWPSAETILAPMFGAGEANNFSHSDDQRIQQLLTQASSALNRTQQSELWKQINTAVVDQGLVIPLRYYRMQYLYPTGVRSVNGGGMPYGRIDSVSPQLADLMIVPSAR